MKMMYCGPPFRFLMEIIDVVFSGPKKKMTIQTKICVFYCVQKHDAGHLLFDLACEHLGIVEKQYFSLQISEDTASSPRWLDPNKPFKKQLKGTDPFYLIFRVRFFISDPNSLQHEQTRHFYFSQIKKDIREGRGLSQSEAELCYLNTARTLDLYGVELHSARDANNPSLWVGIASGGGAYLICFTLRINVIKISFKRKRFFIHLRRKHVSFYKIVSVSMPSSRACKNLWRSCVDHHTFYNRKNPHAVSKPRYTKVLEYLPVPLYRKLIGDMMWNPIIKSLSTEDLETKSLPSRSPPSTPNWRSPRLRHDFRKPRPSSVDNLTNEMSYVTESEDNMAADGELLLVRISPDQDGKFGFNVKGGVDQKMPLAISHVNPNSPAGRCVPALLEGDQVLLINGRDISEHTHQQVVMFIKASRESHSKELALLVRRKGKNVCLCFPSNCQQMSELFNCGPGTCTLEEAMVRLERGLTSGTLLLQFEKLYRKNPGLLISCAKLSENMDKNRYKDVLPYDITRVVLQAEEDNYINASHVKTEPAGAVLQYMAAQGPLPHTCTHFWRSVWEQGVTVIIMLTTLTERGRTKCHQYWPHPPEVKDYDYLQVCCHSEECNLAYVTRELTLKNTQLGQKRSITHLQYVAWPDHGVPEESSDFLDFVQTVRSKRRDTEPLMVHCSAGIGRTGVLITMETALILMESAKPVYPLEIVTSLREQRAMMVQTSCQFSFVCEAILRVYRERFKPSQTPSS
uniref:protein-tyrosine-phosphatase n=1 Tax=Pygocentrus nattereri TaxID=42514 RepID=A0AAR2IW57_PYGNA